MPIAPASPSALIRGRLAIGRGGDPGRLPIGLSDHARGVALAFGTELRGDPAALGLHALEHALSVGLRQIELTQVDVDHLDAEGRQGVGLDRAADLGDQGFEAAPAGGGRDEGGERVVAERGADLGEHHVSELALGAGPCPHRLEEPPGVGDPPEREAADHDVLLVGGQIFRLARPGIQQPAVDRAARDRTAA